MDRPEKSHWLGDANHVKQDDPVFIDFVMIAFIVRILFAYTAQTVRVYITAQLLEGVTLGDGCVVGVDMTLADLQVKDRTHYYKHNDVVQQRHSNDLPQVRY